MGRGTGFLRAMATAQANSVKEARAYRRTGSAHRLHQLHWRTAKARTEATVAGAVHTSSDARAQQASSRDHRPCDSTTPTRAGHVVRTIGPIYLGAIPRQFRYKQRHRRKQLLLHAGTNRDKRRFARDIRAMRYNFILTYVSHTTPHCRSISGSLGEPALRGVRERRRVG